MITRRGLLDLGARAIVAAATTYGASCLLRGTLLQPARPAVAGRLEYTVTSLDSTTSSPPITVVLQPQGAPAVQPTPTPFGATALTDVQVQTRVPETTAVASLTAPAGSRGFRLTVQSAENLDGASFVWQSGTGSVERGASVVIRPDEAGALAGHLFVEDSAGRQLAQVPLVRLVAYDTPPLMTGRLHIGVEAHINFDTPLEDGGICTIPDVLKAIARTKEMGMTLVRTDWIWEKIERAQGVRNWSTYQYDEVLGLLAANGLGSVSVIKGTPLWASSAPTTPFPIWWNSPPWDPRLYGQFVYAFLEHYGPVIKMLEVYQEPNVSLYWNFDAAGLAACQCEAFLHAKYADPFVTVGLTGLVGIPERATLGDDGYWHYGTVRFEAPDAFLRRVYEATSGRVWWDTVGLHTYPDMDLFRPTTGFDLTRSIAFINSIKAVKQAFGDATPLSVTEIGTSTPRDWPPPHQVAQYLGQLIDTIRQASGTPLLIWYRLNEGPNRDSPDDRRGLATYDLTQLTPIGQMMKTYIQQH